MKILSFSLLSLLAVAGVSPVPAAERPNVIVIFTDDHGYADLSCMGLEPDVKTPHLDRLAAEGVRFTNGYVTAPQCGPSRVGLLTGQYQNRFGYDTNGEEPIPLGVKTIADRLGSAGYKTGMVGKWHLEICHLSRKFIDEYAPGPEPGLKRIKRIDHSILERYYPSGRGFQETFFGYMKDRYWATYDLKGGRFDSPRWIDVNGDDRLDVQTEAALRFIDHHHDEPFFLYLAYYGPHVPLESSRKYIDRFPGEMPERRRTALAMISAIDDGAGRIMDRLDRHGIDDNTLIFFISDNGAPLHIRMNDLPLSFKDGAWDGSKNTPLNGEKGMLSEGGIRVPFLARWKGAIPGGKVIDTPVITLDVAATACAAAGLGQPQELDGANLIPMLKDGKPLPERTLFWRFWNQIAVRRGDWKFIRLASRQDFLFNLAQDRGEKHNQIDNKPDLASQMLEQAKDWSAGLKPPGLPKGDGNDQEAFWYEHYLKVPLPGQFTRDQYPFN